MRECGTIAAHPNQPEPLLMTINPVSYYRASATDYPAFAALSGRHEADTVIIGGGFAGLNTAIGLAERGHAGVVLLEAGQLGHGASGRNGGFAFGGYSLGEAALRRSQGAERAKRMYDGTLWGVDSIRRRAAKYDIPCDPVEGGVIWANWFRDPEMLRGRQRELAEHYGVDWRWMPQAELRERIHSERYSDALFESSALHLHPLNYAIGLGQAAAAQGVAIHERSPVVELRRDGSGWNIRTAEGEVKARRVVHACGGYIGGYAPRLDRSILPISTYVMVTEPLGPRMAEIMDTSAAVYDTRFAFDYYRPLKDGRLLWGGRITVRDPSPEQAKDILMTDLLRVFPQLRGVGIDYAWSGLMGYSKAQMPQIGELEPGLWMVHAFGGHGVAPTAWGGELIASAIAEGDTRWKDFAGYQPDSAFKPFGFAAAQLNYWWLQTRDAWKDWREGR